MPNAQEVGARLAQLRREKSAAERRDLLQEEVAQEVGVSEEAYNRYEKGRRMPKPAIFARIAQYWGVTERWLHYGPEELAHDADDITVGAVALTQAEKAAAQEDAAAIRAARADAAAQKGKKKTPARGAAPGRPRRAG
jgi:transcriptional regulator with XRE-family HTH domain